MSASEPTFEVATTVPPSHRMTNSRLPSIVSCSGARLLCENMERQAYHQDYRATRNARYQPCSHKAALLSHPTRARTTIPAFEIGAECAFPGGESMEADHRTSHREGRRLLCSTATDSTHTLGCLWRSWHGPYHDRCLWRSWHTTIVTDMGSMVGRCVELCRKVHPERCIILRWRTKQASR